MRVTIMPGALSGTVDPVISSKSVTHRVLICAALSGEPTRVERVAPSADALATQGCLEAMGCRIQEREDGLEIVPGSLPTQALMDCGESGSTLRFMLPVAAALGIHTRFTGRGKLPQRPLSPLYEEMTAHGVSLSPRGVFPLEVKGRLQAGTYALAGNVSSQFITGLLMALPLTAGDSTLRLLTPLESASYVGITLEVLRRFGIRVAAEGDLFRIPGGQRYQSPGVAVIEGDWSGAAFWLAAGALSGAGVTCRGLNAASVQGDRAILPLLRAFGARVTEEDDRITVQREALRGIEIDAGDIPDLVPVLAAVAAFAEGRTVIRRIARLRLKESDRVETVLGLIRSLGGRAEATEQEMTVFGGGLHGGRVDACGDHRIAMAAAVAGSACAHPVEILGAECVAKSYPGFFEVFRNLGGKADSMV
ncbi:MAG: 3-phosphoshikimate 1-carboxyvinyltransferase [Clostridia bacterium]|nr:3-phosphoshikimate 1-carboxyvinyltransferase [Clostridia bacterium]